MIPRSLRAPRDERPYRIIIVGGDKCGEWGRYAPRVERRQRSGRRCPVLGGFTGQLFAAYAGVRDA